VKEKTINGFLWSFVENFSKQGINFVIGIILARLLLPEEFGLIGMITVFIAVSTSFVNSGFTQALIRKKICTVADYSTVFYFNLITGVLFVIALYFAAPLISNFFNEPILIDIVRVLSLVLIFDSLSLVQRSQLTKRIDFKLQTKLTLIADSISGIIAIIMAYAGFSVWSLVVKQLIARFLYTALIWIYNRWIPSLIFSKGSFKELFGFGSKLLLSGLLDTIFQNIYLIFIGKYFSASALGFYTRADQFKKLPSQNINSTIQRVSYPVLANLQDDPVKLRAMFRKILGVTMYITFILMIGLCVTAQSVVLTLLGEKWAESISYLQLLALVGVFYPLHSLNLNLLNVFGHSGKFLTLEVIKKFFVIPAIIIGIFYGIDYMIICMIANSMVIFFLNSYWTKSFINYSSLMQLLDILPAFLLSVAMGVFVFSISYFFEFSPLVMLICQVLLGMVFTIFASELIQLKEYLIIKRIIVSNLQKNKQ